MHDGHPPDSGEGRKHAATFSCLAKGVHQVYFPQLLQCALLAIMVETGSQAY